MTYFSDDHRQPFQSIQFIVGGQDVSKYVVYEQTTIQYVAAAQPGTATIVLADPDKVLDFTEGAFTKIYVDGIAIWAGYAYTIDRGFWFSDKAVRKWTIHGVDLNILFDKLYVYNHAFPNEFPDNGGAWFVVKDGLTIRGVVPMGTTDGALLRAYITDSDLNLISPAINPDQIYDTVDIFPDQNPELPTGYGGMLMEAGKNLRAGFEDVSANANLNLPGSYIYYITPEGSIFYNKQDLNNAPFAVGQGSGVVSARDLIITTDISTLKNDVIIFANQLNPAGKEVQFRFRHNSDSASIGKYGRFQYAENVGGWSAARLQLRSERILFREGAIPAKRAEFTIFKPGLLPGQIVNVFADEFGIGEPFPIRSMSVSFPTPYLAAFTCVCSYDTNDPYGLLLALKRPASRGFVPPRFVTITPDDTTATPLPAYTYVREIPKRAGTAKSGAKLWRLHYAYIRYSMVVHIGGLRALSQRIQPNTSLDFYETDPDKGIFATHASSKDDLYVEYHVAHDLET